MSVFDEPFAPWGEITTFGNPWHGYLQAGNLFRLDDAAMTLPSGIQHYPAPDGSARLIDIGAPAVITSPAEQTIGMTWWNKALLTGSGFGTGLRSYGNVHSSGSSGINFRAQAWPYKCPDGTVYILWYSGGSDKKIRAEKSAVPTGAVPANDTGGTVSLDLSSIMIDYRVVGANSYPLFRWLNFSPAGHKAALHTGYLGGGYRYTYQIIELSITGGDDTTPPTVTQTAYRSLETPDELDINVTIDVPYVTPPGWWVSMPEGIGLIDHKQIWCVDFDVGGEKKELGYRTVETKTYEILSRVVGSSTLYYTGKETDSVAYLTINDANALEYMHVTDYEAKDYTAEPVIEITENRRNDIALGYPALINGALVTLTNPMIGTQTNGIVAAGSVSIYALVGANGVVGTGRAAIDSDRSPSDIAVNPQTGSFSVGRTRYF